MNTSTTTPEANAEWTTDVDVDGTEVIERIVNGSDELGGSVEILHAPEELGDGKSDAIVDIISGMDTADMLYEAAGPLASASLASDPGPAVEPTQDKVADADITPDVFVATAEVVEPKKPGLIVRFLALLFIVKADISDRTGVVRKSCERPLLGVLGSITLHIVMTGISLYGLSIASTNPAIGVPLACSELIFAALGRRIFNVISFFVALIWAHDDGIKIVTADARAKANQAATEAKRTGGIIATKVAEAADEIKNQAGTQVPASGSTAS